MQDMKNKYNHENRGKMIKTLIMSSFTYKRIEKKLPKKYFKTLKGFMPPFRSHLGRL